MTSLSNISQVTDEQGQKTEGSWFYKPLFEKGTYGVEIHDIVQPLFFEKIAVKHDVSNFVKSDPSKDVKKVIIVAMIIFICVRCTVHSGADEGLQVLLQSMH